MSDEHSISVAELLARAGGDAPASNSGGRRRRHRGGENSVTVAELTGEIPVIRDTDARQADAAQAAVAPQAPADEAPTVDESDAETAGPDAQSELAAESTEGEADEPITSSFLAAAVETARSEDEPDGAAQAQLEQARTERTADEHADASVDQHADTAADQHADTAVANAPELDARHNTNEQHVEENYAWSQWSEGNVPIMATSDFNTAQVRERQARIEAENTAAQDAAARAGDRSSELPPAPDTAAFGLPRLGKAEADEAGIDKAADTDTPAADTPAADTPAAGTAVLEPDQSDALAASPGHVEAAESVTVDETDVPDDGAARPAGRGGGWLALIAEVVLGIAAGAALFYGFFRLWQWRGGTPTIALTVVLAFIVVIAIVLFTHYLRKATDFLTLGLALLVGLVITFGPLLLVLATD